MPNARNFPPFCLDLDAGQLLRDGKAVTLRAKTWAVLHYLVEHAGCLVTKHELLSAVWPKTAVSEATLTVTIGELRAALGDHQNAPRYIETVRRRGFRFMARVHSTARHQGVVPPSIITVQHPLVGRESQLGWLTERFELARAGQRQVIFLTGEAGIGKTSIVDAFVRSVVGGSDDAAYVASSACVATYGDAEPFMPVFEALAALGRNSGGHQVIAQLRRHAPAVLDEMPDLLPDGTTQPPRQPEVRPAARILRFVADALEALADMRPLVLVLEDLHWSDPSTVDLLAVSARRRAPARLMLIGTYRPADAAISNHPIAQVKAELLSKRLCIEIPLDPLSSYSVYEYLRLRLGTAPDHLEELARLIHQRTEGNPSFVEAAADKLVAGDLGTQPPPIPHLLQDGATLAAALPIDVGSLVQQQLGALAAADRRVLEIASVVGAEFSASTIAAVSDEESVVIDGICHRLAGWGHILSRTSSETSPDGALAGQYAFRHELVRQELYDRLAVADRAHIHHRVGAYLEGTLRSDVSAVSLAEHFERAGDTARLVTHLQRAADFARHRCAYAEAIRLLQRALDALPPDNQPATLEARWQLQRAVGEAHFLAGEPGRAHEWFALALETARQCGGPDPIAQTVLAYGRTLSARDVDRGDTLVRLIREGLAAAGDRQDGLRAQLLSRLAYALYWRAEGWSAPGQSEREMLTREALCLAHALGESRTLAVVLYNRHWSEWSPDNLEERRAIVPKLMELAEAHRDLELLADCHIFQFCNALEAGDRAATEAGAAGLQGIADELAQPWYAYMASVLAASQAQFTGRFAEAHRAMERALALGMSLDEPLAKQVFDAQRLVLAATQGCLVESVKSVRSLVKAFPDYPHYRAVLSWILADLGRLDAAQRTLEPLAASDFTHVRRNNLWLGTLVAAACATVRCGDVPRAATLYDHLLPHADRGVTFHLGLGYQGSVARYLAMLAGARGMWEAADDHFHAAVAHDTALGATPWVVQTQLAYVDALLIRRRRGDLQRARELLRMATDEAATVGLEKLASRSQAWEMLGVPDQPSVSSGAEPTPTAATEKIRLVRRK